MAKGAGMAMGMERDKEEGTGRDGVRGTDMDMDMVMDTTMTRPTTLQWPCLK